MESRRVASGVLTFSSHASSFTLRVPPSILKHHRTKLFPSASAPEDALSLHLAPPPSPFKARSLLSLDKSARRRSFKDSQAHVTDSPTMKRLTDRRAPGPGLAHKAASMTNVLEGGTGTEGDVFKVPAAPRRNKSDGVVEAGSLLAAVTTAAAAPPAVPAPTRRAPRKQENPRPLPRGDSHSTRSLINRREVNLARRPSSTALARKKSADAPLETAPTAGTAAPSDARRRKLPATLASAAGTAFETHRRPAERVAAVAAGGPVLLVPDTPSKDREKAGRAFARAASAPSFAALGREVRPGLERRGLGPGGMMGVGEPRAPVSTEEGLMDWQGEDGFVSGRRLARQVGAMGTPEGKRIVALVPDT